MSGDTMSTSPTGYYYTLGHPLRARFDDVVRRLCAAGLHVGAHSAHQWRAGSSSRALRALILAEESRWRPLELGHKLPLVLSFLLALSAATMAFMAEVLLSKEGRMRIRSCWLAVFYFVQNAAVSLVEYIIEKMHQSLVE